MRTDHLDLVQLHHSLPRAEVEAHDALDALVELKDAGKVRFIGVSGTLPHIDEYIAGGFDAFQLPYSALQREYEAVIRHASSAGIGTIIRGGIARGVPSDWRRRLHQSMSAKAMRDVWSRAGLDELSNGMDRLEFMLRFTLSNPDIDTLIVGTANPDHLARNVAAACMGPLPGRLVAEAKEQLTIAAASLPAHEARSFRQLLHAVPAGPARRWWRWLAQR